MEFRINIKPNVSKSYNKKPVDSFYRGSFGTSYSKYYAGVAVRHTNNGDFVVVCNYEKRRKKVKRFDDNGKKLKKPIVTRGEWVHYYYSIPVELLKLMNKRVVQHSRHWTLEDLK